MNNETEILKKRFLELSEKPYYTFTDFLGLAEQSAFAEILPKLRGVKYTAFGGAVGAERIMIRFGSEEDFGYDEVFPIACVKVEPLSQKFADKLCHRDFLGALLNLGIERSTLGDIAIIDNVGYIFAKEDIAKFITEELTRVKRTDVRAMVTDKLPEGDLYKTDRVKIQISSERIDAIIAKVYSISRDESLSLFKKHLVYVGGKLQENNSYNLKPGEKCSVRGYGRFIYLGYEGLTRKGRLCAEADVYV